MPLLLWMKHAEVSEVEGKAMQMDVGQRSDEEANVKLAEMRQCMSECTALLSRVDGYLLRMFKVEVLRVVESSRRIL